MSAALNEKRRAQLRAMTTMRAMLRVLLDDAKDRDVMIGLLQAIDGIDEAIATILEEHPELAHEVGDLRPAIEIPATVEEMT